MEIEHDGEMIPVYNGYASTGVQRYSDQFRVYCLSLYAGDAGRRIQGVVELLQDRHGIVMHRNTLYVWAKRDNWDTQSRELYQLLRPGYINDALDSIVTGAREGATILRDMANGSIPTDYNRAKVILALMDRAGLMPHSAVAEHIRLKMTDAPAQDTAALSDAELRELEASYQPDALHIPESEIPEAQVVLAHSKRRPE